MHIILQQPSPVRNPLLPRSVTPRTGYDIIYLFYFLSGSGLREIRRKKFESPADAGLSNRSIGAEAPAAAFGKTASADFASAGYNDSRRTGIKEEVLNKA
jgi:hypothetical protein